jgi:hypothetical protein
MLCREYVRRREVGDFVLTGFLWGEIRNVELPEGRLGTIAAPDVNGEVISKGRARSLAEAASEHEPLIECYSLASSRS